jgi:hypothetical protein
MYSTMIGKIEKAIRYSQEPQRIVFTDFQVTLEGDHRNHQVAFHDGTWGCDCDTFRQTGYCSHSMAMERVLRGMVLASEASPE